MADRNYAMDIANALARADAQSLAVIGYELLASLGEARGRLASFEMVEREMRRREEERIATRRAASRERQRRHRSNATSRVTPCDSPSLSPTPPIPTPSASSSSSAREAFLARRLPSDQGRNALTVVLTKCGDRETVLAELGMILDGGRPGVSMKPENVELALIDYAANEARWNSQYFRRYVQRITQPTNTPRRGGVGQRTFDNAVEALKDIPEAS